MGDFWAFLLQTLTASGAAVLLLIVKAMFRDKLSPRWQFAVWGILGLVLLIPAGLWGRYALLNWPMWVEALKSLLTGSYTLTRVTAPVPLPSLTPPATVFDWLYWVYVLGVLFLLGRYLLAYVRLRLALKHGRPVSPETAGRIQAVADRYHLPACRGVEVEGLGSAFVCGVFSPVLALPAGKAVEDKVLLHELLHLKHRDVVWGILICLLRCLHWCNPLLWYCADEAGNDLESLCDQRVLERLEGEDRREYGQILLSMANEKYARSPGTSSASNGGKNIRRRIEAIVRFKRYPAGMALVSVCAALMLAAPLVFGSRAVSVYDEGGRLSGRADIDLSLASARTTWCTTMAGALDAYGKSLLVQSGAYRAMCAPLADQANIAQVMGDRQAEGLWPAWDTGLPIEADRSEGYYIYNLEPAGEGAYQALVAVKLNGAPDGQWEENTMYLAYQQVRVWKEGSRWVVAEQGDIQSVETVGATSIRWSEVLPAYVYSGTAENFRVEVRCQKTFAVDNTVQNTNDTSWFFGPSTTFDTVPKPNAQFDEVTNSQRTRCVYLGPAEEKAAITQLGVSVLPLEEGEERPTLPSARQGNVGGSSTQGDDWASRELDSDWGPAISMGGGGGSSEFDTDSFLLPDFYAADLYINGEKAAELTLRLQEGGAQ